MVSVVIIEIILFLHKYQQKNSCMCERICEKCRTSEISGTVAIKWANCLWEMLGQQFCDTALCCAEFIKLHHLYSIC